MYHNYEINFKKVEKHKTSMKCASPEYAYQKIIDIWSDMPHDIFDVEIIEDGKVVAMYDGNIWIRY